VCLVFYFLERLKNLIASNNSGSPISGMSTTLLLICLAFLLLTTPINAFHLFKNVAPANMLSSAWRNLWQVSGAILLAGNYGINIILYCLSGKKFRGELGHILPTRCSCFKRDHGKGSPSNKSLVGNAKAITHSDHDSQRNM
jgi:hypothetical protein